jgi:hypothetical protein
MRRGWAPWFGGRVRNRNLLSLALTVGTAAVLVGAPATGAVKIPRIPGGLPRAPKVTQYRATLDVAGYMEVKVERDETGDCQPGQDVTIDFESSFELGRGRATAITVLNGVVASGIASARGGVSSKGTLSGYRETNYCPPARKVELRAPACTSGKGKLTAILATDPEAIKQRDGEVVPLNYPVLLALTRFGGSSQDPSCTRYLNSGIRSARANGADLSVFETKASGLVVPIGAHNISFSQLRKGQWLRRVVRLNGACNHVLIGNEPPADASRAYDRRSRCTVRGKIYLGVRRTS